MDWGHLRGQPQGANIDAPSGASIPAGFDAEDFLRGAKMAYTRLQASWDKRDLDDIAEFAGPAVMKEVRAQTEADPAPSTTEVLLINARLLSVAKEGGAERATVFFDVLLREDPQAQATTQAREVWHFARGEGESWKLDGIQQVEG
jgi:predicted lipid-binding transport protein (Tim44 family)